MDGVATLRQRSLEHGIDMEIRFNRRCSAQRNGDIDDIDVERVRVGLGVHAHRLDAHAVGGAGDSADDLATVGDEEPADRAHLHQCLHTP